MKYFGVVGKELIIGIADTGMKERGMRLNFVSDPSMSNATDI